MRTCLFVMRARALIFLFETYLSFTFSFEYNVSRSKNYFIRTLMKSLIMPLLSYMGFFYLEIGLYLVVAYYSHYASKKYYILI